MEFALTLNNCFNFFFSIGCPVGWQKYDEKCLKYFPTQKTWKEASESCKKISSRPSYLVSVPDAATNKFILTKVATADQDKVGRVWTGGHQNSAGTWVWSDGSGWSYADWYPGEPNNAGGDEDYLEIITLNYPTAKYKGKWNDHRNSHKAAYICQLS